jgi:hypothetical protein
MTCALDSPVRRTEGWVTMIDGILATAALASLALNDVQPNSIVI